MKRRALLACGVASSVLYVYMSVVVPMRWEGYSSAAQTVSELSAIGAPTRGLWVALGWMYTLLVFAFGWGVWTSAGGSRPLRIVGGLLIAYAVVGVGWPFAPMHARATEFTTTDVMHIAFAMATVLLMLLTIGVSAIAFGTRFRAYAIVTLMTLVGFGMLTGLDSPKIAQGLPTPWIGVWERIDIGVFLLWVVVLAIALWRVESRRAGTPRTDECRVVKPA